MGRNNKTGFIYYNVDTDRYQDYKIKRLKSSFGCSGIAVYDYILCEIYRVKGCFLMWDESTAFDVADYFGLKESLVHEIVNYCCVVGLFSKELLTDERVITSLQIQKRFLEWSRIAKRANPYIPEKMRLLPEETRFIPEEKAKVPEEIPQSKVKESKEKKLFERAKQSFLTNAIWQEQFAMSRGLKIEVVKQIQKKWVMDLELKGETPTNLQQYFINAWNKGSITLDGVKTMKI